MFCFARYVFCFWTITGTTCKSSLSRQHSAATFSTSQLCVLYLCPISDDNTTIQEIDLFHAQEYNWIYSNRPRNVGAESGFDGHIPSQDPAYDLVAILAELQLASQCRKLVHGSSGFATMIATMMSDNAEDLYSNRAIESYFLDTGLSEAAAFAMGRGVQRGEYMLRIIHEQMANNTTDE